MIEKSRKKFPFIVILILFFIAIGLLSSVIFFSKKNITSLTVQLQRPNRNIYLGLWTDGFFNNTTHTVDPSKLQAMEQKIGKNVAIANYYRGWEFLGTNAIVTELNTISSNGWRPMVSANPYFFSGCVSNGKTLYKAILSGNCDTFLHQVGEELKNVKQPFFLRFAWEMNVVSMPWSVKYTGDSPLDFILAWRHVHDIVTQEGAKNIIWVFSPQIETPSTTDIALLYPGDQYVDWTGLDGYNWGTTKSWSRWQDFYSIFYDSYNKMLRIAPKKSFMVAEVNTASIGGDQASWYTVMLSQDIPVNFPKVAAIIFFNEDKLSSEGVTWLIDKTPQSLSAFRKAIQDPIYKSHF